MQTMYARTASAIDVTNIEFWSLPMTMAWVIWQDMQMVLESCKDHCDNTLIWTLETGVVGHIRGSASAWKPIIGSTGWALGQKKPPTVFDVMTRADKDTAITAQADLWEKFQKADLRAMGIARNAVAWRWIDPDEWLEIGYFDAPAGRPDAIGEKDGAPRYYDVRVRRADVLKIWPEERPALAKRGRKRKVAPDVFDEAVLSLMDKNGEFDPDNPAWNAQARLVEALIADFTKYQGDDSAVPDRSNIIRNLPTPLAKWREMKEKRD